MSAQPYAELRQKLSANIIPPADLRLSVELKERLRDIDRWERQVARSLHYWYGYND